MIMVGFLSISACTRDVVEESASAEESAIDLAKMCTAVDDEAGGLKMSAQEAISLWEKDPKFTSIGWEAIDVDESEFCVVFNYKVDGIDQLLAFHVELEGGTAEKIGLGNDGLEGDRYMSRIIRTSSYPRGELEAKLEKVITKLLFQ